MENDWTLLAALAGLASLIVGMGLLYAYRRILPYKKDPDNQPHVLPAMLVDIFTNFIRTGYGCLVGGIALLVFAHVTGPGLATSVSLPISYPVSLAFSGTLGLLLLLLTYNVLCHRVRIAIEEGGSLDEKAERIVRVHANFTEYVPMGLALMILLDLSGAPTVFVCLGGGLFTFARIIHAWGYTLTALPNFGRVVGIQLTLGSIAFMALSGVYFVLTRSIALAG